MTEKSIIERPKQELVPDEEGYVKTPIQVLDAMRQSIDNLSSRLKRFDKFADNLEELVKVLAEERKEKKKPTKFEKFQLQCRRVNWEVNTVDDVEPLLLKRLIDKDIRDVAIEAAEYMRKRHDVKIETDATMIYRLVKGEVVDDLGRVITEQESYWKGLPETMLGPVAHRVHRLIIDGYEVANWNRSGYIKKSRPHSGPYEGTRSVISKILAVFEVEDKPFPVPGNEFPTMWGECENE